MRDIAWQGSLFETADPGRERLSFDGLRRDALDDRSWLDVGSGDEYEIAFLADNPGIWMDHCHNLPHASLGLVAHLMYAGVSEPFRVGGSGHNEPE